MPKKLIENRFEELPLGTVKPLGYLKKQLTLQNENITSKMEAYRDFLPDSGWLGGTGESWERAPYYVRGLTALAYTLGDESLIKKAKKWINAAVESQKENGDFGPEICTDWWAKMPMLMAVRDYYLAEKNLGFDDGRIITFFEKYFKYQLSVIESSPLKDWAVARGADNVYVVYWFAELCEKLGKESGYLYTLAEILLSQTQDWVKEYTELNARQHVVNTTQGFRMPYIKYRLSHDCADKDALKAGIKNISSDHGRIDDLPNSDEAARDNLPTRGTETCAVVEGMLSFEICGEITGESYLYDLLESYCYNSLPNSFTYDMRQHNYFQMQNAVLLSNGYHEFDCDHGDSSAFSAPCGFECCFSNLHMGYPKFVQNMFMKTKSGIAAVCYGSCRIETVINGKKAVFTEITDYPYKDSIKLVYDGETSEFELMLRIPQWSESAEISGAEYMLDALGEYIVINRTFNKGDEIEIKFKSQITANDWHHNTKYIKKGAVLYCMPIKEEYRTLETNDYRELKTEPIPGAKRLEIYPAESWNYTICGDLDFQENEFLQDNEISPSSPPCVINAQMKKVLNWKLKGNIADTPEHAVCGRETVVKQLIPYAFSRLKISCFPKFEPQLEYTAYGSFILPEKTADTKTFSISGQRAYDMIQISFDKTECDYYALKYKTASEEFVIGNIKFNPYKNSECFSKDKTSFSADNDAKYTIQMFGIKNDKITRISNIIKI